MIYDLLAIYRFPTIGRLAIVGACVPLITMFLEPLWVYQTWPSVGDLVFLLVLALMGAAPYLVSTVRHSQSPWVQQWAATSIVLYAAMDLMMRVVGRFYMGDSTGLMLWVSFPIMIGPLTFVASAMLVSAWRSARALTPLPAIACAALVWWSLTFCTRDASQAGRWDHKTTMAASGVAASLGRPVVSYSSGWDFKGEGSSLDCCPLPPSIAAVFASHPPGLDTLPGLRDLGPDWQRKPWRLVSEIGADSSYITAALRHVPDLLTTVGRKSMKRPSTYFGFRYNKSDVGDVTLYVVDSAEGLFCEVFESG